MGTIGFFIRAWWEEKQAEGAAVDERIHLESATKGQYKLFHNTYLRNWFRFSGWLSAWLCDFSYPVYQLFPGEFFLSLISDMGWYMPCCPFNSKLEFEFLSHKNLNFRELRRDLGLISLLSSSQFKIWVSFTHKLQGVENRRGSDISLRPRAPQRGMGGMDRVFKWTLMLYKSCMPNNAEN